MKIFSAPPIYLSPSERYDGIFFVLDSNLDWRRLIEKIGFVNIVHSRFSVGEMFNR